MTNDSLDSFIKLATEEYFKKSPNYTLLYNLTHRCRIGGFYYFGYFCGKLLEPLNNWQYLEELALCAYYIKEYQESYDIYTKILNLCPKIEKERILTNRTFSAKKLN